MKRIDIPPTWLLGFAALVWLSRGLWTAGTPALRGLGTGLVIAGVVVMALAVIQMARQRTTVIPRRNPTALVSSGIFRLSRNPIYLGDALVLAGLALRWDAPLGWIAVPLFIALITHRFIRGEEARLEVGFGAEFTEYMSQTRRWI